MPLFLSLIILLSLDALLTTNSHLPLYCSSLISWPVFLPIHTLMACHPQMGGSKLTIFNWLCLYKPVIGTSQLLAKWYLIPKVLIYFFNTISGQWETTLMSFLLGFIVSHKIPNPSVLDKIIHSPLYGCSKPCLGSYYFPSSIKVPYLMATKILYFFEMSYKNSS